MGESGEVLHHRRSIRLAGYDYTQPGAYFITICTRNRECVFGEIVDGAVRLSAYGQVLKEEWERTPLLRPYVELDAFVIMPNHFHAILVLTGRQGAANRGPSHRSCAGEGGGEEEGHEHRAPTAEAERRAPTAEAKSCAATAEAEHRAATREQFAKPVAGSVPTIVRGFKSAVCGRIKRLTSQPDAPIWQRNYYEHVIRNDEDMNALREYIVQNPRKWEIDQLHPDILPAW